VSGPAEQAIAHTLEVFADVYGAEPTGVWAAPGRVNVIGEHTDYNQGFVLPMAIDRACYAAATPRADRTLRLHAAQFGATVEVPLDGLEPGITGWAAYPAGVAWALAEAGFPVGGADIALSSVVPVGSGLSSSAALECAAGLALAGVSGFDLSRSELARIAQRAENAFAGVPCGPLDQLASAFGEDGAVVFIDTRTNVIRPYPFDLASAGMVLLVVDTRVSHDHGDNGYADRRTTCESAAAHLGIAALRDVSEDTLEDALAKVTAELGESAARRVRHVVTEDARVEEFVRLLDSGPIGEAGRLVEAGRLMTASHASLRDDYEVSCEELDVAVDAALAAGAHGARMTGGGFGGSAIALVGADRLETVKEAVSSAFADAGFAAPAFFPAVASVGARRVK
jgi:galactokinase